MKRPIKTLILLSLLCLAPVVALAQSDCPAIIQAALDATDQNCDSTSRNQACYGNITLESQLRSGVSDTDFDEEGERVDVASVSTLTLRPWNDDGTWGIALMKLQTSLPDTLPGQNVTFLLFGNVQIENGVETNTEPVTFEATAQGNVTVRSSPSADSERIGRLVEGDTVTALGRNADNSWLQVELSDDSIGWVSADLIETNGEISLLNVVDLAEPVSALTPMQAFYFQTGIADAPCAEAPDSGILVQTPKGVGQIEFTVNEVNIRLGSTIYLQAQPAGDMTISVVEGQAEVEAAGVTVIAPAGTQVQVPLDNNRRASGPPVGPSAYGNLSALPVRILERAITVATPLTANQIALLGIPAAEITAEATPLSEAGGETYVDVPLISGRWQQEIQPAGRCTGEDYPNPFLDLDITFTLENDSITVSAQGSGMATTIFQRVEPGVYFSSDEYGENTLSILTSDHFTYHRVAPHILMCEELHYVYTLISAAESEATPETTVEPPPAETSSRAADDIELVSGEWQAANVSNECNTPNPEIFYGHMVFEVEDSGATLTMTTTTPDGSTVGTYARTEQNTYFLQASAIGADTLRNPILRAFFLRDALG